MSRVKQLKSKNNQKLAFRKTQKKRNLNIAISLFIISLIIGTSGILSQCQKTSLVTPEQIEAEIIPKEGDSTAYGIPLSINNTQKFIEHYNSITLTSVQNSIMQDALQPLKAPCCDDNSMATCCCPCNLAKAVWGLARYLIAEKDYNTEQVKESVLQWLRLVYSNYYIIQELKNKGVDPGKYGLSHENACYVSECELQIVDRGCGGMRKLIQ